MDAVPSNDLLLAYPFDEFIVSHFLMFHTLFSQSFTDEQSSSFVVSVQQWVTLHIWPPPHLVSIAPSTVWGMRGLPFLGVSLYFVLVVLKKGVEECLLLREIKLLTKMARSMNSKESSPNSFKILDIHPHLCPEIDLNQY